MSAAAPLGRAGEAALRSRSPDRRHPYRYASDAEVVAAVTDCSLVQAAGLIERFGSLRRLARAAEGELVSAGLPEEAARRLSAGIALGLRVSQKRFEPGTKLHSPEDVIQWFRPKMMFGDRESMMAVLLSADKRVIGEMEIALGRLNAANMTPREVFSHALRENAAGVILIHNHPSGETTPSRSDRNFTEMMARLGRALKVELIDSLVVGEEGGTSLRRESPGIFQQEAGGGYREQLDGIAEAVRGSDMPVGELVAQP